MARKNIRTSNRSKEITYKDVEKALEGRDLSNLSYKDMYELEQLGFGDWLGRNWGNVGMAVGGGVLAGVGALGSVFTGGASLAATGAGISMMGKGISGMSADAKEQSAIKAQNQATAEQNALMQRQAQEQALFQRTGDVPLYGATFRDGGQIPKYVSLSPNERSKVDRYMEYRDRLASMYIDHFRKEGTDVVPFLSKYNNPEFDFDRRNMNKYVEKFHNTYGDLQLPSKTIQNYLEGIEDEGFSFNEFTNLSEFMHTKNPINQVVPVGVKGSKEANNTFDNIGFGPRQLMEVMGGLPSTSRYKYLDPYLENLPQYAVGGTINYEGQSHEGPNRGIPVDELGNPSVNPVALTEGKEVAYSSDGGTYIFSDRLKYSKSKTFAQRAKDLQKKYELRAKTKGGTFQLDDPVSKKGYDMDMQELIGQQEQLKEMTMPQQPQQMGYGDMPMFGYGNTSDYNNRRYNLSSGNYPGGPQMSYVNIDTGELDRQADVFSDMLQRESSKFHLDARYPYLGKTGYTNLGKQGKLLPLDFQQQEAREIARKFTPIQPMNKFIDVAENQGVELTGVTPVKGTFSDTYDSIMETFGEPSEISYPSDVKENPLKQYQGMHWGQAALSALPDVASGITNIIRGSKRRKNNPYDKLNAPHVQAEQISLENERAAAREQANVARANTSRGLRAGAATSGSYMANMLAGETGIQRGLGQQLGDSYQREVVANAQMRQQAAMANQQMEMQARGYNAQMEAQNRAQADAMTGAGISQVGQGVTSAYNQYAADRRHVQSLNMMSPDYALYHDKDSKWYNPKYTKKMTPEGKANQAERLAHHKAEMERYRAMGAKTVEEQLAMFMKDNKDVSKEDLIELINNLK